MCNSIRRAQVGAAVSVELTRHDLTHERGQRGLASAPRPVTPATDTTYCERAGHAMGHAAATRSGPPGWAGLGPRRAARPGPGDAPLTLEAGRAVVAGRSGAPPWNASRVCVTPRLVRPEYRTRKTLDKQ